MAQRHKEKTEGKATSNKPKGQESLCWSFWSSIT